jgi:NADPH-dependent 2,4-dienoyl-CoA reductase/sulfur reductase-like enzyme
MKSLFRLGLIYGGYLGVKSFHTNVIRSVPPDPNLHEKKNKKIVVVGAGIVGLATAYYLSRYEDNEIVLVEKATKCATECSV